MIKKKRLQALRDDVEHILVFCAADLNPSDTLTEDDVDSTLERLPEGDDGLEQLQVDVRRCLAIPESLATILGDERLDDRVIRQLLQLLDRAISLRLGGATRLLVVSEDGFRGGLSVRAETAADVARAREQIDRDYPPRR